MQRGLFKRTKKVLQISVVKLWQNANMDLLVMTSCAVLLIILPGNNNSLGIQLCYRLYDADLLTDLLISENDNFVPF